MNYLILANCAPLYYNFYRALREELRNRGHNVFYALDSEISRDYNGLNNESNVFIFTNYLKDNSTDISNLDEMTKDAYDRFRAWNYYPDFDRSNYFAIIPKKYSNERSDYHIISMFLFLRHVIEKNSIHGIFYENASNLLALTAEDLANNCFSIPYYGIEFSRFPERAFISRKFCDDSRVLHEQMLKMLNDGIALNSVAQQYITNYIKNFETISPSYVKIYKLSDGFLKRYFKKEKLGVFFFSIKNSLKYNPYHFLTGIPAKVAFMMVWRYFKRMLRSGRVKRLYFKNVDKLSEKFIVYPLHFHPEASTSVLARNYESEYEIIRNVSFSLPLGFKLYVKEHPSASALDDFSLYDAITKLPNVRFVPHYLNAKELIKRSCGVVTLTSTAGYEALILKKKVLVFGDVFYNCHRNVKKVERFSDLPQLLDWLVEPLFQDDIDSYNRLFLQAYYQTTFHLPLNYNDRNKQHQKDNAKKLLDYLKI